MKTKNALREEKDRIYSLASEILRYSSDYIQYQKFNNNYTNDLLFSKYNGSIKALERYLNIEKVVTEDDIEEKDFLSKINDPLSNKNLKRYVELYANKKENNSYYSTLMRQGTGEDKLNKEKFRNLLEFVFKAEIENLLKRDTKAIKRECFRNKLNLIGVKIIKPFFVMLAGKESYLEAKKSFEYASKYVINDLKQLVDKYGIDYIVKRYNYMNKCIDKKGHYQYKNKDEAMMDKVLESIRCANHNHPGILSFFIDSEMFNNKEYSACPDVRFYLNIGGEDIYKFTEEYVRMALESGIEFYVKVLDAERNSSERVERLVIYSTFDEMQKNLNILNKIKAENPDMDYKKPPITAATIDSWIGFGSEPKGKDSSYNSDRADLLENAIQDVFKGLSKKEILEQIENNSECIKK